nr:peptidylprolyl isomerase [uncultured Sphingomonas sp.]
MLSSLRNLSKSKVGTGVMVLILVLILAGFAIGDIKSVGSGSFGFSQGTLAKVGSEEVTERDLSSAMKRVLAQLRQQNPNATYADLSKDFSAIVGQLIDEETLTAFAKDHGLELSKRLIDKEIAQLPQARGLDGKFSQTQYQAFLNSEQMTDADVRRSIANGLIQRMILEPIAVDVNVPNGVAKSYASMLMEQREGEVALVPVESFAAGLDPSDGDLVTYYQQNAKAYRTPEQRILKFAPINLETVKGATPTDKEIDDYYKANQAIYGGSQQRVISQVVVPSQQVANNVAAKARSGASFADAAKIAGMTAEDISVGPQTREQFNGLAGDKVAAAAFAAAPNAIVGPIQSDLGWHVIRIDDVKATPGKSLAQARPEIIAKLTETKRKTAIEEAIVSIEESIDGGANFQEAAAKAGLPIQTTPAITAAGTSLKDPAFRIPPDFTKAVSAGFALSDGDDPDVVQAGDQGNYVMVGLDRIIPSAAPPLAEVKDRVRSDWIKKKATERARAVTADIAAKAAKGVPLSQAVADAKAGLPPVTPINARRMQISQAGEDAAAPLKMLFTLAQGNSRMVADPQGRGFFVVKTNKITAGDASNNPLLIAQTKGAFQQTASEELAQQFIAATRVDQKARRNEKAIEAARKRYMQQAE